MTPPGEVGDTSPANVSRAAVAARIRRAETRTKAGASRGPVYFGVATGGAGR